MLEAAQEEGPEIAGQGQEGLVGPTRRAAYPSVVLPTVMRRIPTDAALPGQATKAVDAKLVDPQVAIVPAENALADPEALVEQATPTAYLVDRPDGRHLRATIPSGHPYAVVATVGTRLVADATNGRPKVLLLATSPFGVTD